MHETIVTFQTPAMVNKNTIEIFLYFNDFDSYAIIMLHKQINLDEHYSIQVHTKLHV